MDELNGEYHEDFFSRLSASESEHHDYMKEFLMEPTKTSRSMFGNNVLQTQQPSQQQQPQQIQQGLLYSQHSGICGVSNSNNFATTNCFESNGTLESSLSMSMHNPSGVGAPLVPPQYMSNLQSHMQGLPMSSSSLGLPGTSSRMGMTSSNLNNSMGMPVPSQAGLGIGMGGSNGQSRNPYSSSSNQFSGASSNVLGMHQAPSTSNMGMHSASSSGIGLHSASPSGLGLHSSPSPGGIGLHSTASPNNMGMHSSASPGGIGLHPTPSPSGMGMHSSASPGGMGMHSTASPSGMGIHPAPSPSGMGMHSTASPSGMAMHSSASPSGMGMHSSASPSGMGMHSSASPSGMGMHSSASPSGMGMHSSASPSGMGMHSSASPSGMGMHSSASPSGMGMHSSASPSGMGMHSSASPVGMGMHTGLSSPAPSMGKPSTSPSRASLPVASPSMMNMQSARSPYCSSPSQFSGTSPANIPSASPGRLSMPSASPGGPNVLSTSPQSSHEVNGASYSASCSEGSSPGALERLAAERLPSGVTVSVADRGDSVGQPRRTPPPEDVLTITPVEETYSKAGTSGFGKKKDIAQVKKVRRKNADENGTKTKKRKAVRSQVVLSDPHGEPGFGAPSLYDLLTQSEPVEEGSLLSVGGTASYDVSTASGTVKRGRKRKNGEGSSQKSYPKQKTTVTYHSQISSQNGIKLRIKKSEPVKKPVKQRVRKRKSKTFDSDSDEAVHHRRTNHRTVVDSSDDEEKEQSPWGTDKLPKIVLHKIFKMVTYEEGCVPFLVRMQRVCRWWREVAVAPDLWHTIELCSTWVRDRAKNLHTFKWLCENRLNRVRELNLGGWKFSGIPSLLDVIANNCSELRSLNLTGWQGLHIEHVLFLVENCQKLERIDLSSINPEAHNNKGAVSLNSMQNLTSVMGGRLTHLVLANNKLAGVPQIIMAIASACPNLEVLDMSNVRTVAHATAQIHIEKLQEGCHKLRVLRITNSQFALAPVTIKEQVESPGFPELEELSVASPHGRMDSLAMSQPFIDDDAIGRILKTSHKLRLLDVRGCSRITDSSLVRIPAWDLEHLYLSGCYATRISGSGLELITQKWGHSLIELDLGWTSATEALDLAVSALAEVTEKGTVSPLRILNLCGSSVSLEPVKEVLLNCLNLWSLNLASCRALPRGMKRNYEGVDLIDLRSQYQDKPPMPSPPRVEELPEEALGAVESANEEPEEGVAEEEEAVRVKLEADSEPDEAHPESEVNIKSEPGIDASGSSSVHEAEHEEQRILKCEPECKEEARTSERVLDDSEVMTPEDLQMVAEALANTPDADSIAAEAMAESMTPLTAGHGGGSTPAAASSTPRSGTYSEAGTPGPSGAFSEAGTPGPSGTDSGTPGTPGTTTTSDTTPQGNDGDGELLALAQDVKYSLENHLNFSFSELDCGGSLP